MKKQMNITAIIVAVIVVLGILLAVYMVKGPDRQTISVTGDSELTVEPDLVVVYMRAETRADSADEAADANAVIIDAIIAELEDDAEDIETQNYYVNPEYNWVNGKQTLIGYLAIHSLKVSIDDFSIVGDMVDSAINKGAFVNNINFELSSAMQNQYKADAMQLASQDARNKADAIASGLGKQIGDIRSVSTSDYRYGPYPMFEARAVGAMEDIEQVTTNIQPQDLTVYATVNVVYDLK